MLGTGLIVARLSDIVSERLHVRLPLLSSKERIKMSIDTAVVLAVVCGVCGKYYVENDHVTLIYVENHMWKIAMSRLI